MWMLPVRRCGMWNNQFRGPFLSTPFPFPEYRLLLLPSFFFFLYLGYVGVACALEKEKEGQQAAASSPGSRRMALEGKEKLEAVSQALPLPLFHVITRHAQHTNTALGGREPGRRSPLTRCYPFTDCSFPTSKNPSLSFIYNGGHKEAATK